MVDFEPQISGAIDVLLDYKKGLLTQEQAVDRFRKLTGLNIEVARSFLKGISRNNIISLEAKRKIAIQQKETNDDPAG